MQDFNNVPDNCQGIFIKYYSSAGTEGNTDKTFDAVNYRDVEQLFDAWKAIQLISDSLESIFNYCHLGRRRRRRRRRWGARDKEFSDGNSGRGWSFRGSTGDLCYINYELSGFVWECLIERRARWASYFRRVVVLAARTIKVRALSRRGTRERG